MNKKVIAIVAIICAVALIVIMGTGALRGEQIQTIQGEVEVSVSKVSSKLAGRVDSLSVREGDMVTKGAFLFSIATPEVDAKLKQAQAAKSAASAQSQKADAGARSQMIESAKNLWHQAQAGAELASKSLARVQNLYNEGVVAEQQLDEIKMKYEVAQGNVKIAKAQYDMAVEGAQKEDILAARALVERADGAVMEVESYLSDAAQYAPFSGEISTIVAHRGELVSTGFPVITIADTQDPWVSFNVKETLLPQMPKGKIIEVYVPALDRTVEIQIQSMAVQAEYATWTATRSKGSFDIRTFELKAYPTKPNSGLRAGMTVVFELQGAE